MGQRRSNYDPPHLPQRLLSSHISPQAPANLTTHLTSWGLCIFVRAIPSMCLPFLFSTLLLFIQDVALMAAFLNSPKELLSIHCAPTSAPVCFSVFITFPCLSVGLHVQRQIARTLCSLSMDLLLRGSIEQVLVDKWVDGLYQSNPITPLDSIQQK